MLAQVLRSYKRLAPKVHPSVQNGAGGIDQLTAVTEAYVACLAAIRLQAQNKVIHFFCWAEDCKCRLFSEADGRL